MLQNVTGQDVNYDSFKAEFDSRPEMKNLVDKFDANGVTIKTKNKVQEPGQPGDKNKAMAGVKSSAKRAASKLLNK
jgi:hypothetical protein